MFNDHAGINLTESKLQIVEICYKNDSFYLENVDQIVHSEPLIPDMAEDDFIKIIQDSFKKIQNKKPLATSKISFALPNNFFKIFEVPYEDSLLKKDLNEHFCWELSVLYPNYDKANFYIQHIEVDKSNVRKEKKAIILAIEKNCVSFINKFCQLNNLELKYIDNVHLASNAFLYLNKNQPHEISLSIYIDQKFSSISAMEGVSPFYFKVLNPSVSNIFEELTDAVDKLNEFNITLKDFQQVLLYGQDITDNFESKLKDFFGLPLKKINPFERLKKDEAMLTNSYLRVKSNSFTAAAGIAIRII